MSTINNLETTFFLVKWLRFDFLAKREGNRSKRRGEGKRGEELNDFSLMFFFPHKMIMFEKSKCFSASSFALLLGFFLYRSQLPSDISTVVNYSPSSNLPNTRYPYINNPTSVNEWYQYISPDFYYFQVFIKAGWYV